MIWQSCVYMCIYACALRYIRSSFACMTRTIAICIYKNTHTHTISPAQKVLPVHQTKPRVYGKLLARAPGWPMFVDPQNADGAQRVCVLPGRVVPVHRWIPSVPCRQAVPGARVLLVHRMDLYFNRKSCVACGMFTYRDGVLFCDFSCSAPVLSPCHRTGMCVCVCACACVCVRVHVYT